MKTKAPKTGEKSANAAQKAATTAHLLETTAHQAAHTKRHLLSMRKSKGKAKALDQDHAETHMDGTIEYVQKLMKHVQANYPSEGKELSNLENTVARSDIGAKVKAAHQKVKGKK